MSGRCKKSSQPLHLFTIKFCPKPFSMDFYSRMLSQSFYRKQSFRRKKRHWMKTCTLLALVNKSKSKLQLIWFYKRVQTKNFLRSIHNWTIKNRAKLPTYFSPSSSFFSSYLSFSLRMDFLMKMAKFRRQQNWQATCKEMGVSKSTTYFSLFPRCRMTCGREKKWLR